MHKLMIGLTTLVAGLAMLLGAVLLAFVPAGAPAALAAAEAPALPAEGGQDWASRVIRLHVVANSDTEEDQALKRAVRDAVLDEVTPLFAGLTTREEARAAIQQSRPLIEAAAARTVTAHGQNYSVRIELGRFSFPTKAYGEFLLPAGEYTALKVFIGQAQGANWWCVLFPPLCFLDWNTGLVLEPKPGTQGRETVTVPRTTTDTLVADDDLSALTVRPRFRLARWLGWTSTGTDVPAVPPPPPPPDTPAVAPTPAVPPPPDVSAVAPDAPLALPMYTR